ncbi:RNA polymerase sigma factor [Sphingosinicella rhizophila]|uniref:Sigma-70 family RNA polymerase sigma factor n=1 Tax=Sphingosinicella rhizophila TaxID=3050082 RepID=A0ABU3Q286_9SPHN|nr:sigma-70 family RNA polymerase sigma factor [Sphingosinicella sp. GR2756]MDT9597377.1 sigma-70 family RNA polymerase sigma factor [Sphingosinicella sp. GR2756]
MIRSCLYMLSDAWRARKSEGQTSPNERILDRRRRTAKWVAEAVMPHERFVRAWLRRTRIPHEDVDEVIQDCYCRFAMLDEVRHIERPDAYFFTMARNLLGRRMKRAKIVPIEALSEIEVAGLIDETPSPERHVAARMEMSSLRAFVASLPERRRRIVEMRKFEELPQREIAQRLGLTESIVENELYQGMVAVQRAWRDYRSETERHSNEGRRA